MLGLDLGPPLPGLGLVSCGLVNITVTVAASGGSRKKIFGGPGPSSFGRQQPLSEIYYRTN